MPQRTPTFQDLETAKAFAAEETAKNPRARQVYRLEFIGKDGAEQVHYIVAQSVPRAYNHAYTLLRDHFGVKLGVAERKPGGGFHPKTAEELVRALSPEEIDRVKRMITEMGGSPAVMEEKPKRRKHEG